MTVYETITGVFSLLLMLGITGSMGFFIGLYVANKKHRKDLLDAIENIKEEKNDRTNI